MKCENVKELLPFLDDGSLEQEKVSEVKAHLEKCPECRKEYNEITSVVNMVNSVLTEHEVLPSPELLKNVLRNIDRKKRTIRTHRWVFSAAAAVLVAVSVTMYSLLFIYTVQPVPYQMAVVEPDEEFYTYCAEMYLDAYDLIELVNGVGTIDDNELDDVLLSNDYLDISVYDIIETVDENNLTDIFDER